MIDVIAFIIFAILFLTCLVGLIMSLYLKSKPKIEHGKKYEPEDIKKFREACLKIGMEVQGKPEEFCFDDCPHILLNVDTKRIYVDDVPISATHLVRCIHMPICEMWNNKCQEANKDAFKVRQQEILGDQHY